MEVIVDRTKRSIPMDDNLKSMGNNFITYMELRKYTLFTTNTVLLNLTYICNLLFSQVIINA